VLGDLSLGLKSQNILYVKLFKLNIIKPLTKSPKICPRHIWHMS